MLFTKSIHFCIQEIGLSAVSDHTELQEAQLLSQFFNKEEMISLTPIPLSAMARTTKSLIYELTSSGLCLGPLAAISA